MSCLLVYSPLYKESLDPSLLSLDRQWSQIIVTLPSMPTLSHYWALSLASILEWNGRQGHCQVSQVSLQISPCFWALPDPEPVLLRSAVYFISSGAFPARLQTLSREPGTWGMEVSHPIPHSDVTALIF